MFIVADNKPPQTLPDVEPTSTEILPAEPNFELLGEEEFVAADEGIPAIEIPGCAVRGPAVRAPIVREMAAPREPRAQRGSTPFRKTSSPAKLAPGELDDDLGDMGVTGSTVQNLMERFKR